MRRTIEKQSVLEWIDALKAVSGKNAALSKRILTLASKPSRQRAEVNLQKLDKFAKAGENVVVPGKVLAAGSISKSFSISAIEYSADAVREAQGSKMRGNRY